MRIDTFEGEEWRRTRTARSVSGAFRSAREFLRTIRHGDRTRLAGVIDFSYQHYALGDALTSEVNLACLAIERRCTSIDLYLIVDPSRPSAPVQGFITEDNYLSYLDNVLPAFLATPMLRSMHVLRDRERAAMAIVSLAASRAPMWPPVWHQLRRRMTYPMSHELINAFHARHGYIPTLAAPRGYAAWARRFINQHYENRFLVVINPRQSRLTPVPATIHRDAPLSEWYDFLAGIKTRHPDVHFFMVGGFSEWEPTLRGMSNVSVPRTMGLTLAHELALLDACDLFLGTSSGFATMATFSHVPYVITGIEEMFAPYGGVAVGAMRYPFAREHQTLVWRQEDAGLLRHHFEQVYGARSRRRASEASSDAAQAPCGGADRGGAPRIAG
jgi:hypothetical protein